MVEKYINSIFFKRIHFLKIIIIIVIHFVNVETHPRLGYIIEGFESAFVNYTLAKFIYEIKI
jgi:hypothetical protein